jgi:replicative DNA helicase
VREYPGGLQAFLDPQRGGSGLTTPWQRFDETTCGLQEGDLVVIAARTSMGKSIVGMQCAHHTAAKEKRPVAVFSLEMSKESLIRRLIASVARIDHQQVRSGHLSKDERLRAQRAATEIAEIPLWIDDTRARTIAAMSAALRKLKDPPRLIVVDHLQFMKATGKTENRHQELSDIVHSLKHMAGEYKATCMVLSQLNRQCEIENRRPQLSDLRETGTIEEDADIVMFVHRWERYQKYKERLEYRGLGEFLLAKQRNGPLAKFNMIFNDGYQRFDTAANDGGWGDDGE